MKLSFIELENFKSYRDKQKIEFACDNKFITVIQGQMGHGKSNLLNAFYWCIFDQYWDSDKSTIYESPNPNEVFLFNKAELKERSIDGERIELFVRIEFWDDDRNKYIVKRTHGGNFIKKEWKFERNSRLAIEKYDGSTGEFFHIPQEMSEGELQRFFPKSLSNYFLFRGENRTQLVKIQGKEEFQLALRELSKIEVFNRSINHLSFILDKFRRELAEVAQGDLKVSITNALERKADLEKSLNDYNKTLKNLKEIEEKRRDEYELYRTKITENEKAFKIKTKQNAEELILGNLRGQLKQLNDKKRRELTRKWGSLLLSEVIDSTLKRYQEAVENGKYPPDISKSLMLKILNELKCICGRSFVKNSVEHESLLQLQKLIVYDSEHTTEISRLTRELERAKVIINDYPQEISNFDLDEKSLKDQIKEKNLLIENYENQIGNLDESLEILQKKQHEAMNDIVHTAGKIKEIEGLIRTNEKELNNVEEELQKLQGKLDKGKLPALRVELTEKALIETRKLKKKFEKNIYDDLEKYTQENWDLLVYDKLLYDKVILDRQNMYFEVLDKDGNPSRSILNTGHSILLVLSFISALVRIAKEIWKEEFPLVMDAPLSEVGESAMPKAMEGFGVVFNQAIIILKDGSLNTTITNQLKDKIGKQYWLELDKSRQHTKVEVEKYG